MDRINVSEQQKENPASILTYAPPPPRSDDVTTATVAMGRINLHEHRKERDLKNLHAAMAPRLAELAEKHKEAIEAIRNTEEPPALVVVKSKEPFLWEIVDLPLGGNTFFADGKEVPYNVFY